MRVEALPDRELFAFAGIWTRLDRKDAEPVTSCALITCEPNATMRHAITGMLRHMGDSTLMFAPHLNSYRRMVPGSFVPEEVLLPL